MKKYLYVIAICFVVLTGCSTRQVKEDVGEISCNDGKINLRTTSYRHPKSNKLSIHIDLLYNNQIVSKNIGRKGVPMTQENTEVKFMKVNHKSESGLNIYIDPEQLPKSQFNKLVRCIQLNEQKLISLINQIPNQHLSEQELRERQSVNALIYGKYDEMGQQFYASSKADNPLHVYVAIDGTCQLRTNDQSRTLGKVYEGYLDISEVHYNRIKNYQSRQGIKLSNYLRKRNIRVVYEN